MITALGELVRNIAVLVLITMFLQMLLPEGQMYGFIRMIMGVLLISAVLGPVLSFFGHNQIAPIYHKGAYEAATGEILSQGRALAAQYTANAAEDYKEGLIRQINAISLLLPQLSQVETKLELNSDASIKAVYIKGVLDSSLAGEEDTKKKLKNILGDFFNLPPEIIAIDLSRKPE